METLPGFPKEVIVNTKKETKSVVIGPEIEATLPNVVEAFSKVDEAFLKDPRAYLEKLHDSVFTVKVRNGKDIVCSLLYDDDSKKDEILVIFAPFSDGPPKSDARAIGSYMAEAPPASFVISMGRKQLAKPNSWNQTTKSGVVFDLLGALGNGMPVLTIYSPIPVKAYSEGERQALKEEGDFQSAAGIVWSAVEAAQDRLHGLHNETRIDKINLHGASTEASKAIGAASELKDVFSVPSVTVQELIMGPDSPFDIAKRYAITTRVGGPSDVETQIYSPRIFEPQIRQRIHQHGNELGTYIRMAKAVRLTYLRGLTHPEQTIADIENLLDSNVSVLIALAENSNLTHQTKGFLPNDKERVVTVRAEKGQYADHLIDEHVALAALITVLGIKKSA